MTLIASHRLGLLCLAASSPLWGVFANQGTPALVTSEPLYTDIDLEHEDINLKVENDGNGITRHLAEGDPFEPLSCNENLPEVCASKYSELLDKSIIPCGECVYVDDQVGSILTLEGLNIIGKLTYDERSSPVTIKTPYIFVQGELEIKSTSSLSPANEAVRFVLTGTTPQFLQPYSDDQNSYNADSCADGGCPMGKKPFVVAGGKLSISAVPHDCPTWTTLKKNIYGDREYLTTGQFDEIVSAPISCGHSQEVFHHQFKSETHGWTGGLGAFVTAEETQMTITNRKESDQGPYLDITEYNSCFLSGVDYIFTAKIKLTKDGSNGDPTTCAETGNNCLIFKNYIRYADDHVDDDNRNERQTKAAGGTYGDWFSFAATFQYNEDALNPDNVYSYFKIYGPEEGVDIHMEEVKFSLPDASSYPDPLDACNELVLNGDAEGNGMHPYPMRMHGGELFLKEEDGNKFYRQVGRSHYSHGIAQAINPFCMKKDLVYTISMRLRIHSTTEVSYYVELLSYKDAEKTGYFYSYPVRCDPQAEADGWVTCYGQFMITEELQNAASHEIRIEFENTESGKYAVVDYDDISFKFSEGPVTGITIDSSTSTCWGADSEILITSHTLEYYDQQLSKIASTRDNNNGTVTLFLEDTLPPATSEHMSPDFAVEVALLTRNVIVEGANDDTTNESKHGGYMKVYYTPTVQQNVGGIEFRNMGQQGLQDRYPIEFEMCNNVTGSKVFKNTIRDSHQRCIVVKNTDYLTVSENVAYNTAGHCYAIAEGGEVENTFEKNLGALTTRITSTSDHYEEWHPSTFFIRNPNNHLIGNVAAGSYRHGFWGYLPWKVLGESNSFHPGVNPRKSGIGTFKDNVAHSNRYSGVQFENLYQDGLDELENTRSYRNRRGIYLYASKNVVVTGGVLADNKEGLIISYTDNVEVSGTVLRGQTDLYESLTHVQNARKLCSSTFPVGIMMPTYVRYNKYKGGTFRNLRFYDFDNCGPEPTPIAFDDRKRDTHWNYLSSFESVVIDDSRGPLDFTFPQNNDVTDVVIFDLDGSFNPDSSSQFSGTSSIVSNESYMTGFLPGKCTGYSTEFSYCVDACLRTVYFLVESFGTENWTLHVSNIDGAFIDVPGNYEAFSESQKIHDYRRLRRFSASLPAGNYTAEFRDENGDSAWPTFAEEYWEHEPPCTGSANIGDVVLISPTSNCNALVRNGDMESLVPYYHNGGDIEFIPGIGIDGAGALKSKSRSRTYHGIVQYLDTRCVRSNIGKQYEFKAWVKLEDQSGDVIPCDPNVADSNGCPLLKISGHRYNDPLTKVSTSTDSALVGEVVQPIDGNSFNLLHGVFTFWGNFAEMQSIYVVIKDFNADYNLVVSGMSIEPFVGDAASWCEELVTNGDFKTGTTQYWDTYPDRYRDSDPDLEIVTGYEGDGDYALKAYNRESSNGGPRQDIKVGCLVEGERYLATAKYKLEKNNAIWPCNPFTYDPATRCPEMVVKSWKVGASSSYMSVPYSSEQVSTDGWSFIQGVFKATKAAEDAEVVTIWFQNMDEVLDITVDDVSVSLLPKNCGSLVLNPTFEVGRTDFWITDSRENSKLEMYQPGAMNSTYALRSFARTHRDRGPLQYIDDRCITTGTTFVIEAQFRLLSSDGTGVTCDRNNRDGNELSCPSIIIYGEYCPSGSNRYFRKFNDLLRPWFKDEFNDYYAEFQVDEELANCARVSVQIDYVHKDLDIVVDNFNIKPKEDAVPTVAPEVGRPKPTILTTINPTPRPTSHPSSDAVKCPPLGEPSRSISSGTVFLRVSEAGILCTLTKTITDISTGNVVTIVPVARSYEGYGWESSAGEYASLKFACYDSGNGMCRTDLPGVGINEDYTLTSHSHDIPQVDEVARFLESATFGVTKEQLDSWNYADPMEETMSQWVNDQMDVVNATRHREYWRKRVNPRWNFPHKIGRSDHPCDANSRWRKYPFTKKDRSREVYPKYLSTESINHDGPPFKVIIDDQIRTIVREIKFQNGNVMDYDWSHEICDWPDTPSKYYPRGRLFLRVEDDSCQEVDQALVPLLSFTGFETLARYNFQLDPNNFKSASEYAESHPMIPGDDIILINELTDPLCKEIPEVVEDGDVPIFGQLPDGTWLQYDPRLKLEENTPHDMIEDGGGATKLVTGGETLCANAPRTFLNIDNCVMSYETSTCGNVPTPFTEILLDDTNIKKLHQLTGRYVYWLDGLVVRDNDNSTIAHPCTPGWRSRWEKSDSCSSSNLGQNTLTVLSDLIRTSSDSNPIIRDIIFPWSGVSCDPEDTEPEIHFQVDGHCWTNVHPEHKSVYDMTYWTREDTHPGNMHASQRNAKNPIKKWAENGMAYLKYPSTHPNPPSQRNFDHSHMRWDMYHIHFQYVGRYMDPIRFRDLPNELRLEQVAEFYGAVGDVNGTGIIVCGSEGEVSNEPSLGSIFDATANRDRDTNRNLLKQREIVWTSVVTNADDQLRQRMAWALSQILVVVSSAIGSQDRNTEIFLQYYDIFVNNAFGNYRDILREISYSPMMAENLSFLQSKSFSYMWERYQQKRFADENFAREIMQLFTIGLYQLNLDGTPVLKDGKFVKTYSNDDIMSYARAWTGFDRQLQRGNTEDYERSGNRLDPMKIEAVWRDRFPKTNLNGGYIGDGYALCADFPDKMFLRKGAVYRLLGGSNLPELLMEDIEHGAFVLNATSNLKARLCNDEENAGICHFSPQVELKSNLICMEEECEVEAVRVVQAAPGIFYEYVRPPCVEHAFFNHAKKLSLQEKSYAGTICGNPLLPVATEACCLNPLPSLGTHEATRNNMYNGERMSFDKAEERCSAISRQSCDYDQVLGPSGSELYHWTTDDCHINLKIDKSNGLVAIVHEMESRSGRVRHVDGESENFFEVFWDDGKYPNEENECSGGKCHVLHGSCYCSTKVLESVAFQTIPPSREIALSTLSIGAVDPSTYDTGTYTSTTDDQTGIIVHHRTGNVFDHDTIFEVQGNMGQTYFLKNVVSMVHVRGLLQEPTDFKFRNAPHFMSLIPSETNSRDAHHETEAVLDSYFFHDNTAPFISKILIQRFGVSNPSPNYVKAVATAFRSGLYQYGGQTFGDENYGNLASTVAAILFERDARAVILDADLSHGSLKEPLLKVVGLMRNMMFSTQPNYPEIQFSRMDTMIGQMAHNHPSVFSFFLPEYAPDGPVTDASLVSPEAMILDMPKTIALLNGMISLVKYGLADCNNGFGFRDDHGDCRDDGEFARARGILTYQPDATYTSEDIVNELATLMTSGRLNTHNREIIKIAMEKESAPPPGQTPSTCGSKATKQTEYNGTISVSDSGIACQRWDEQAPHSHETVTPDDFPSLEENYCRNPGGKEDRAWCYIVDPNKLWDFCDVPFCVEGDKSAGLRLAQQLITTSAEFHTNNPIKKSDERRVTTESEPKSFAGEYKAVVFLMFAGGCDSYNMLVPHTCSPGVNGTDLFSQYQQVRGEVALIKEGLLEISANNQNCEKFGIHPNLQILHDLYNDGDAMFFANTGALNQPVTKDNYQERTVIQLFAHNTMQNEAKRVDPYEEYRVTGIMGRMADALSRGGIAVSSMSIDQTTIALAGEPGVSPQFNIINARGVKEFNSNPTIPDMMDKIEDINNATSPDSGVFAEMWSSKLLTSISQNDLLRRTLESVHATTIFPSSSLGKKLELVTRMMQTHTTRDVEKEFYFVQIGGFDTHSNMLENLASRFTEVHSALEAFVNELKTHDLWDSMTLIETSDFARTLTPNGGDGTDHAWGGNYFMLGGSVKGGQILGNYPEDITDGARLRLSRGRVVPETSWDHIWNGIAQWMGVEDTELDRVCPNRDKFNDLFDEEDLFVPASLGRERKHLRMV